jgi:hypothetical protein
MKKRLLFIISIIIILSFRVNLLFAQTFVTQPSSQTICIGGTFSPFNLVYTGGAGTPNYQWYINTSNTYASGTIINGATSPSYTLPISIGNTAGTHYVYCVLSFSGSGASAAIFSNIATIQVLTDPIITTPISASYVLNSSSVNPLSVIASGGINNMYNYQWFVNNVNSTTGGVAIANAINSSYTPLVNTIGTTYYYCQVTQSPSSTGCISTSGIATVSVVQNTNNPTFTLQTSACPGTSFSPTNFTPTPNATYQWLVSPSTNLQNCTGLNSATPTFNFSTPGVYSISVNQTLNTVTTSSTSQIVSIANLTNVLPDVDGMTQQLINGITTFTTCVGGTPSAIVYNNNIGNGNPLNTVYSYSINGGAASSFNNSVVVPINYGNNTFLYTATNGTCSLTNTINIYSGAIPYVAIGASNSLNLCPGSTVNFTIDPTPVTGAINSPGTSYSLVFSDVSGSISFANLINDTVIPHQYLSTSCGVSNVGTPYPNNTYHAMITAQNPCGTTQSSFSPITIHNNPTANFSVSDSTICTGQSITITNSGIPGSIVGTNLPYNCTTQGKFYWTITGGTLGTNFTIPVGQQLGSFSQAWASTASNGSGTLNITFLTPGYFTITQNYYNACGTKTKVRNIAVGGIYAGTNQTVCAGSPVTLTAVGGSNYNWTNGIQNGVPFVPIATQTYTVNGTLSNTACTITSGTVTVFVNQVNPATIGPNQAICAGNDPTIINMMNGATGTGVLNYQWQLSANSQGPWTSISGQSNTSYDPPLLTSTSYYQLNTSSTLNGVICSVNSSPMSITVNALTPGSISGNQTICVGGDPAAFTSVVATSNVSTLLYQWQSSTDNTTWSDIIGATNETYNPPVLTTTTYYRRQANAIGNAIVCQDYTNVIQITVIADPIISTQPLSTQSICIGGTIAPLSFSFSGGSGGPSYQWFSVNGNNYLPISGGTNAAYSPSVFNAVGTYEFAVQVTQSTNGCQSNYSSNAQIIVVGDPILTAPVSTNYCQNASTVVPLSVTASGGVNTNYLYQWFVNTSNSNIGGTAIPGANAPTYTPPVSQIGAFYYYCIVTINPSTTACTVSSLTATIIVTLPPFFTTQPIATQSSCIGNLNFSALSVAYSGGNGAPSYQWYVNTVNNNIGGTMIPGATTSVYIPPSNIAAGTYYYYCIITFMNFNGCSSISSNTSLLTIIPEATVGPVINQVVCCQTQITPIIFLGQASTYYWTASASPSVTGYPSSGIGNIPSFFPVNSSSISQIINFIVTPQNTFGCTGSPVSFSITVLPCSINVNPQQNLEYCNGDLMPGIIFTGNAQEYYWVNTNPTIGIPTSGTGNIAPTSIVNLSSNNIIAQIIVTPSFMQNGLGCMGNPEAFYITTYPTPNVFAGADTSICNGSSITLNGSGAYTYNWSNGVTDGVAFTPTATQYYELNATDVNGCDNSDSILVSLLQSSTSNLNIQACDLYTLNGETYSQSGIYNQTIPNSAGCDSTINLNLTLDFSPATPSIYVQNEVNLSTDFVNGLTYQWINCTDQTPIIGQFAITYNPPSNGVYAVVVTNGCGADTSLCTSITTIGLDEYQTSPILLYPNPNNGAFVLEMSANLIGQVIQIYDMSGRLIQETTAKDMKQYIEFKDIAPGSYWLKIGTEAPVKLVKN